jgi:hypothetical protein
VQGKVEQASRLPKGINTPPWALKEGWSIHPFIREPSTRRRSTRRKPPAAESSKLSRRWPRPTLAAMAVLHGWAMAEFWS